MRLPIIISPVIFAVLPTPMFAQFGKNSGNTEFAKGDFFIVSSIDLAKKQLLLKRPTEVTELMRVDGETRCFEERGKHHNDWRTFVPGTVFILRRGPKKGSWSLSRF